MLKLDRTRDFGRYTPPEVPPGCDRPAHFVQNGHDFDQHGREIVPGTKLKQIVPAVAAEADRALPQAAELTAATLLAQSAAMPWAAFQREAKRVLGGACPAGKAAILAALRDAQVVAQASVEETDEDDDEAEADSEPATAAAVPSPAPGVPGSRTEIDLAAWGRGKDYIFGEVRKAIRAKFNRQVSERRDALDFLLEQGIVTAAQARQDV